MRKKKILLVDDSKTSLFVTQMILRKEPYDLLTAPDGAKGVATALAESPDLILMDVVMPGMNGFEAVQELRSHDQTRQTPVIMVTTRGEEPNVEAGFACGCNDYVTKPVDGVTLLSKIRSLLAQPAAA